MPPRKKVTISEWPKRADGTPVNPNTVEGMRMAGVLKPDYIAPPYTEELIPANAQAIMAMDPQYSDPNCATLWKPPPEGTEWYRLQLADEKFPEINPMVCCKCDSENLDEVLESMLGTNDEPRYRSPANGLEFEFCAPPPGFFKAAPGWDQPRMIEEFPEEDEDEDKE